MKAEAFEELLTSVRQLGAIRRGEQELSRSKAERSTDVIVAHADLEQSKAELR